MIRLSDQLSMRVFLLYFLFNIFLLPVFFQIASASEYADLVLYNGKIITVDENETIAEAIAVQDSLIMKVGTNAEIQALVGPDTDVRNLNGKTVTPGMIDAHTHLMYYGQAELDYLNLRPPSVTTIAELTAKIAERVSQLSPGEWIIGDGFFELEDDRMPNKYDLDPVSPDNPVFLNSLGGHYGSANSAALEAAGIDSSTPNPVGGIVERDSLTGEPNGVFWNHPAMDLVRKHYPQFEEENLVKDVMFAQERYIEEGVTSFQEVNCRGISRLRGYIDSADSLKLRGYLLFTIEKPVDAEFSLAQLSVYQGPWLSFGGDKFLLDGQPPTSYTYEWHPGPSYDFPTWNPDTLKRVVKKLHQAGHQLAFHAMGDKAIDLALDALQEALEAYPRDDHRHRIEHLMIPTTDAIQRMKELDIIASVQPAAIYTSGDYYLGTWGAERCMRLKPLRSLIDAGVHVALGTDYPTVPRLSPKYTLWGAVARKTESGYYINTDERITIQEALHAHTMGSAYAAFEEDIKGSLEEGKYADMTIWGADIYSIDLGDLPKIHILGCVISGNVYINEFVGISAKDNNIITETYSLFPNYPNPFNPVTQISYRIARDSRVSVVIYNLMGQRVANLVNKLQAKGQYTIQWDASQHVSGIYFVHLQAGEFNQVRKITLLK